MTRALAISRRTVIAAALMAGAAPRAMAQGRAVTIPIASDFAHLMVRVRIDGKDAWAGLDNGAETTMVDRAFAPHSDLDEQGRVRIPLSVSAGPPPPPLVEVEVAPGVDIVALGVGDLTGSSISDEVPIAAVIGMELFGRYRVDIDFTARAVALTPATASAPPPAGARAVPLVASSHRKHLVEFAIEGGPPVRAVLDLGCARTLMITPDLARRLGLTGARTPSTDLAHGLDGNARLDFPTRTGSLRSLTFAGRDFADVPFEVADLSYSGIEADALLGLAILRRFDLTFDLAFDRLWVRDTARAGDPFGRRSVGLQVEEDGASLKITHVAAASPALAAGFAAGEVIVAIDGAPPRSGTLRNAAVGQTLVVTLAGGVVRKVTAARFD